MKKNWHEIVTGLKGILLLLSLIIIIIVTDYRYCLLSNEKKERT